MGKKIGIMLAVLILMIASSLSTYIYTLNALSQVGSIALSMLSGKIIVSEGVHLKEINSIDQYDTLLESVIKNKISTFEMLEKNLKTFIDEHTLLADRAFLHLRLGLLYDHIKRAELAKIEYNIALDLYNMNNTSPATIEELKDRYKMMNISADKPLNQTGLNYVK